MESPDHTPTQTAASAAHKCSNGKENDGAPSLAARVRDALRSRPLTAQSADLFRPRGATLALMRRIKPMVHAESPNLIPLARLKRGVRAGCCRKRDQHASCASAA